MGSRLTRDGGAPSPRDERPRSASVQAVGWWPAVRGRHSALSALLLRPDRPPPPKATPAPYMQRVRWIREMQALLQERRPEQAAGLLAKLRKDLGLEGTSLDDVLYKHTAFLNLVDPISHELLMSLARDIQCPKKDLESLKSAEKLCRQLIYHLTPHSKWQRQSASKQSPARLKVALQMKVTDGSLDLSGMALLPSDMQCLAFHLQMYRDHLTSIDLSFTELTDQSLQLLLPFLAALPKLTNLALNGNRLTRAVLKDMTEMLKEPRVFPALSWVDLGNNADICSMPQPLLVGLRRRCSLQGALPTIQEYTEGQPNDHEVEQAELLQSQGEEDELHKFREEQAEVHQSWEEQAEVHKSQEEEAEVHQSQEEQAEFHQYREEVGDDNQSREDMGEVYQSQQEGQGVSLSPEQEPGVSRSWENDGSPWQGLRREAGVQRHYQR